jgi:O-antigen/teichoic acid export membrane protein
VTASATAETVSATAGRAVWRGVGRSAASRLLVLPVSAGLGIVLTRVVIEAYGPEAFAQYGLLVGIGALLPFADLGMSAAVLGAVGAADRPAADEHVRRVLTTAIRVLLGSALVLTVVAVTLTVAGLWPGLLGSGLLPDDGPLAAMACLVLIAAAMPFGVGQRVLSGLGHNHVTILVLGAQTPLVLGAVLLLVWADVAAGAYVAVVAYAATLLLSAVLLVLAARRLHPALGRALRDALRPRSRAPGAPVFGMAWPMLVQMLALPLAMQTDRIVLSHRSETAVLAEYNLAWQMFTPIYLVVAAGGMSLWPVFARARARGQTLSSLSMSWVFGAAAAAMALVVGLLSPWLADLASGGAIRIGPSLVVAFCVLTVLQAVKYPLGMSMTDAAGLRFQAYMIVAMLPVNTGLSWWLAGLLGAPGPLVGSIVGVTVFQVLANVLYVRRAGR